MKTRGWLTSWANEIHNMGRVRGEPLLVELSAIVAMDEQADRTIEGMGTTRETASLPVFERDDVDPVFLSPIKENYSSNSASLTSSAWAPPASLPHALRPTARVNTEMTPNASQVHPVYIHLQGLLANFVWIASRLWFRCVFSTTDHAAIPLTTSFGSARFVLSFCFLAMWTCLHSTILAQFFSHSH